MSTEKDLIKKLSAIDAGVRGNLWETMERLANIRKQMLRDKRAAIKKFLGDDWIVKCRKTKGGSKYFAATGNKNSKSFLAIFPHSWTPEGHAFSVVVQREDYKEYVKINAGQLMTIRGCGLEDYIKKHIDTKE